MSRLAPAVVLLAPAIAVLSGWAYQYFTYKRGARLITGHRIDAGPVHSRTDLPAVKPAPPAAPTPPPPA